MKKAIDLLVSRINEEDQWWVRWHQKQLSRAADTVGCLGFLDGLSGTYQDGRDNTPDWVYGLIEQYTREHLPKIEGCSWVGTDLNWSEGRVNFKLLVDGLPFTEKKSRPMKLSKVFRATGITEEQFREFETRELRNWGWKVSANPADIITMSYDRPWTSCMRPKGSYEDGIFSDVRAGSALLFWFRPGASQPCGRQILRPIVIGQEPRIHVSFTVYGNGPSPSLDELEVLLGTKNLLVSGSLRDTIGVLDGVYSDPDGCGIKQNLEVVEECEEALINAFAPYLPKGSQAYPGCSVEIPDLSQTLPRKRSWYQSRNTFWRTKNLPAGETTLKKARKLLSKINTCYNSLTCHHKSRDKSWLSQTWTWNRGQDAKRVEIEKELNSLKEQFSIITQSLTFTEKQSLSRKAKNTDCLPEDFFGPPGHDLCYYCGGDNGPNGEWRQGWDCCYCGAN